MGLVGDVPFECDAFGGSLFASIVESGKFRF